DTVESALPLDVMSLEVGYELIRAVDPSMGGTLVERITALRKQLAIELGIVIPPVHIRDNLQLEPSRYRFMLLGTEIAFGTLRGGKLLAMDPTGSAPPIAGEPTKDPTFGTPARWIAARDRELAESRPEPAAPSTGGAASADERVGPRRRCPLVLCSSEPRRAPARLSVPSRSAEAPETIGEAVPALERTLARRDELEALALGQAHDILPGALPDILPGVGGARGRRAQLKHERAAGRQHTRRLGERVWRATAL